MADQPGLQPLSEANGFSRWSVYLPFPRQTSWADRVGGDGEQGSGVTVSNKTAILSSSVLQINESSIGKWYKYV